MRLNSRICTLLEQWIHDHPTDFAVPGTAGALQALIKQILRQPHTLYYGSDFLPFLEILPTLQDQDSSWAVTVETVIADSDELDSDSDGGYERPLTVTHHVVVPEQVADPARPITLLDPSLENVSLASPFLRRTSFQGICPQQFALPEVSAHHQEILCRGS